MFKNNKINHSSNSPYKSFLLSYTDHYSNLKNKITNIAKDKFSILKKTFEISFNCFKGFLIKYSDILESSTILTLDICFLLGSIFSFVPSSVFHSSFILLNFVGIISFPFFIDLLKKHASDLVFSAKHQTFDIMIFSALKVILIASSFCLILLGSSASILNMQEKTQAVKTIYDILKKAGGVSLIVGLGLDIYYYFLRQKSLCFFKNTIVQSDAEKISNLYINNDKTAICNDLKKRASYLRTSMDKDTWKVFFSQLKNATSNNMRQELLKKIVIKNIQTQQLISKSDFTLKTIGYLSRSISYYYPGSVVQAITWTSISFFYTMQLAVQKYQQAKQQSKAKDISA